jgi:hypothetical protein
VGAHKPLKHDVSVTDMKAEYDLSQLKSRKNPYAPKLKKPVAAGGLTADFKQKVSLSLDVNGLSATKIIV